MYQKYAKVYKANNVSSLSRGEQIARLLEMGANHIKRAKEHCQNNQFESRYNETEKCMTIVSGLMGCLDRNPQTEEMCNVLENYYQFIQTMLAKININNNPEICDLVIESLQTMADTWRQIERQVAKD